ncbi:STAS domain-containing protein [bacterium]|nr:STAS domain-containing protein [bacterium]
MAFKTEEKSGLFIIHCPKDIDTLMGKQIHIQMEKWTKTEQETIALNFSEVKSIDADGFRALSLLSKAAKDSGKKFVTVNPNKKIATLILSNGLEGALNPIKGK